MIRNGPKLLMLILAASGLRAQAPAPETAQRHPKEYQFWRTQFESRNGKGHQAELEQSFNEIVKAVERIQQRAPQVTLGGMLSLVVYESRATLAFYNTRDSENSFRQRLDRGRPFAEQPFARYSYQFGLVPVHTSILRPCMAGTQPARKLFDQLAKDAGFVASEQAMALVRTEFGEVCGKVLNGRAADQPRAADYYILNSHRQFNVPVNKSGSDVANAGGFPFYSPAVTTPLFFREIESKSRPDWNDRNAISAWGGGDGAYGTPERQDQILEFWRAFERRSLK